MEIVNDDPVAGDAGEILQECAGLLVATVMQEERYMGDIERPFIEPKGMRGTDNPGDRTPVAPGEIAGTGIHIKCRDIKLAAKWCERAREIGSARSHVEYGDWSTRGQGPEDPLNSKS